MKEPLTLGSVMVDCKNADEMQAFYAELLGWEKTELFSFRRCEAARVWCLLFWKNRIIYRRFGRKYRRHSKSKCILIFRWKMCI